MIAGSCSQSKPRSCYTNTEWMISRRSCSGKQCNSLCFVCTSEEVHCYCSAALSVKMSILLYLPGLVVILFKRRGLLSTLRHLMTIAAVQTMLANSFLAVDRQAYLKCAFNLQRVFLYKWTVNWRMIGNEFFLSRQWAVGLLAGHVLVLVLFGLFRWCRVDGGVWSVLARGFRSPTRPAAGPAPITADCASIFHFIIAAHLSSLHCG